MPEIPDTRYARTAEGAHIAFQTFGSGDIDLLFIPGYYSNVDANWDVPEIADLLWKVASFARVITIDRR
ncbi:MAG: adenylate/guanylate cyclase domain-containing protein, partial [Actinomycetota bacterium]